MPSVRRQISNTLDRRGLRPLLGLGRSAEILIRERELCTVLPDKFGWILRSRSGVLVVPEPSIRPPARLRELTMDIYCYRYVPKPGDVVVDVGAGVGQEAFAFGGLVGPNGAVHSIEAHPVTYSFLERMVALNHLECVHCHNLAVSDSAGSVALTNEGPARHYANRILREGGGETKVVAVTLEQFFESESLERVDLLTMNIEGAERLAIKGMSAVVDRVQNVVIACHDFLADERGDESLRTKELVRDFLTDHGFLVEDRLDTPYPPLRGYLYGTRGEVPGSALAESQR